MPKKLRETDRSFRVEDDTFHYFRTETGERRVNRFIGNEPEDAGKKAGRALLRSQPARGAKDSVIVMLRETTRKPGALRGLRGLTVHHIAAAVQRRVREPHEAPTVQHRRRFRMRRRGADGQRVPRTQRQLAASVSAARYFQDHHLRDHQGQHVGERDDVGRGLRVLWCLCKRPRAAVHGRHRVAERPVHDLRACDVA